MPLYDFECDIFGHRFERLVKLADFDLVQRCSCGSPATRMLCAPLFNVENVEYDCPITGKMITSRYAHEENLRLHDCRVREVGETDEAERRVAANNAKFEREIEDTVEREFEALSSDKKERLTNELLSGIDTAYERAGV